MLGLTGRRRWALVAFSAVVASSGCGRDFDPLTREGMWHPDHANRANLEAMVANPTDLVRGSSAVASDGQMAAAAVDRLRNDKVKRLPANDIASVASGANESQAAGAP